MHSVIVYCDCLGTQPYKVGGIVMPLFISSALLFLYNVIVTFVHSGAITNCSEFQSL